MDLDHDEPDTAISTKLKGKGTKKGLIARDQINSIASRLGPDRAAEADRGPNAAETKRKGGPNPVEWEHGSIFELLLIHLSRPTGPNKKAKPPHPTGLVRNWQDVKPIQPSCAPARTLACTPQARTSAAQENYVNEAEDTPAYEPGGISSDEEGVETHSFAASTTGF